VLALFVGRGPTLVAAVLTALSWDYYFLPPLFAFRITHLEDAFLLVMYFVVAVVLGQLTTRIRRQEAIERQRTENATALFLLTRDLTESKSIDEMLENAARHIEETFHAKPAVLLPDRTQRLKRYPYPADAFTIDDRDRQVAAHVFAQGKSAGKFTQNMPVTEATFFPLSTSNETLGVIGLKFSNPCGPTVSQTEHLTQFVEQIAMSLARVRLREVSEKSKLLAESERLSKTLLNSVSHEIRTPIAAIKSAVTNLADEGGQFSGSQKEMVNEIQEATERLDRVVGNVLEITRLESGRVKPRINLCDVRDLIQVVLKDLKHDLAAHKTSVAIAPDLPLVQLDFVLTQQALHNLVSNAAFHTPPGTAINIGARVDETSLILSVADNGPGIAPECIARIFDKFYRAPTAAAGGIGLGLAVTNGLMLAQGGQIQVENRSEGGAQFTIRLPLFRHSFTVKI
jgi:two-component system, OmpR family, sensor histidine kinase KdpD